MPCYIPTITIPSMTSLEAITTLIMTHQQFISLCKYSKAHHNRFRPAKAITSKRMAKNANKKQQGRALVPLDRIFLKGEYKR